MESVIRKIYWSVDAWKLFSDSDEKIIIHGIIEPFVQASYMLKNAFSEKG